MRSSRSWWVAKARRLRAHLSARVQADERAGLVAWLSEPELALFDAMHVSDGRHGLDVVTALRRAGVTDRDVLVAGLLHDCAKGDTGAGPRVAWSLGEALGPWVVRLARRIPGWEAPLHRLATHAERSAELVEAAGGSPRAVELIRHQAAPTDPEYGRLLQRADETS
jgi:hypothetical protein